MDTGDRFRKANEFYANPIDPNDREFEAQVRMNLLPRDWPLVSKENATTIGDPRSPSGLMGIYFGPNASDSWKQEMGIGSINPMPRIRAINTYLDMDDDKKHLPFSTIYRDMYRLMSPERWAVGVGAGASPGTFAHEFRHHAKDKTGWVDDSTNHLLDVVASPSKGAYLRNIDHAYEQIGADELWHTTTPIYNPYATFAEKEKVVLDAINAWNNKKSKHHDPEHRVPNNIFEHYRHNVGFLSGSPQEKYSDKNLLETSTGMLPRSMVNERAAYPFLNFLGSNFYNDAAEAAKRKDKKAEGGTITMPNNYRAGGRVRMI